MEECLGVFDDATYFLTDINGEEQDWTSAVLLQKNGARERYGRNVHSVSYSINIY